MDAIFTPLLLVTQAAVFLAPGLLAALWLTRIRGLKPVYTILVAALIGSLIGFAVFWGYLLKPAVGEWLSVLSLVAGWVSTIYLLSQKKLRDSLRVPDIILPLVLMFAVTM